MSLSKSITYVRAVREPLQNLLFWLESVVHAFGHHPQNNVKTPFLICIWTYLPDEVAKYAPVMMPSVFSFCPTSPDVL